MTRKKVYIVLSLAVVFVAGTAFAAMQEGRTPVEFFKGHTHTADGHTIDAPQHSGGTDRYGCHNASVPYHCH